MRYRRIRVISGKGSREDQFAERLRGIAVDRAGQVWAVGDLAVKAFTPKGELLRRWPTVKPGHCLAVKDDGTVLVGQSGQIESFAPVGDQSDLWRDRDRFGVVTAIGFGGEFILVADARARCIRRYDGRGQWLNDIRKGTGARGFVIPNGYLDFAVDAQGIIHAVNSGKHRIERYSLDGEYLGHFGRFGTKKPEGFPGCCNPTNLALTTEGHVVVTEKAGPRVKVYTARGDLLTVVATDEFDENCKNMDVATDLQDRIYVVDTVRLNIHVFALVPGQH